MGVPVDGNGSGSCPEEKLGIWFPKAINPLELICKNKGSIPSLITYTANKHHEIPASYMQTGG